MQGGGIMLRKGHDEAEAERYSRYIQEARKRERQDAGPGRSAAKIAWQQTRGQCQGAKAQLKVECGLFQKMLVKTIA